MRTRRMKAWFCFVGVLLVFICTASVYAETDEDRTLSPYFLVKSDDPETDQLALLFTAAEVDIAGVIADVTVTQVYKNEGTRPIEAIYVFPGSTRSAVYGMTMTVGERTIVAQIQEKQQARKKYETAKREGKTASLLEQHRPNVFQMNVANILPGDKIQVTLRYTELLVPTDGVYEFVYPTVVGPRYSNKPAAGTSGSDSWVENPYLLEGEPPSYIFDIQTDLSTGIPIQEVSCPSHQVDFTYKGPTTATVTLDDTEIVEKVRRLEPDHLKRLTEAVFDLYVGKDFGSLPAFYGKLFQLVSAQETEEIVERQEVKTFTGDRDYILRYRLAGEQIASGLLLYQAQDRLSQERNAGKVPAVQEEEENFFLLMVQSPERVITDDIPPREYLFIVDVSGSMNGFPLNISKKLLKDLIGNLRPEDTFNVLLFAGSSKVMAEQSIPATKQNVKRAITMIDKQRGGGGTELLPALQRAFALPKQEGVARTIVIATDGYVHVELEAFDLIRQNLHQSNVFTFGIGTSVNRFLIEGMARAGLGEAFVLTDAREASAEADRFRKYIQTPVLTGIECNFGDFDAYDVEPVSIPDVLAERPMILFGKWRGTPQGTITLSGYSGQGEYQQIFNVSEVTPMATNSALRYLWARKRIEMLGDYNTLRPDDKWVKDITQLGLTYNLLTKYTSFVAIDKVIRRTEDNLRTVKQPAPLPKGVSNAAVGGGMRSTPESNLPLLLLISALLLAFALRPKSAATKTRGHEEPTNHA